MISGATSGQSGLAEGTAANAASQSMQSEEAAKAAGSSDDRMTRKKKKGKADCPGAENRPRDRGFTAQATDPKTQTPTPEPRT